MAQSLEVKIVGESGYDSAVAGMLFSFEEECPLSEIPDFNPDKAWRVAKNLAPKNKGHNKFLEHLHVEMYVRAGLDWWKQMDTYRVGVSKLSKSTMHTIMRKPITAADFDDAVDQDILDIVEKKRLAGDFRGVSKNLPQGFLQTRKITISYKTIRDIREQRLGHKLVEWDTWIEEMHKQVKFPSLL